jgi:hypothetical protein
LLNNGGHVRSLRHQSSVVSHQMLVGSKSTQASQVLRSDQ